MADLVRRSDVLALAKDVTLKNGAKHRCIDATLVHEIPSAQPERKTERWIPCSERLPEKNQMVITTIVGSDVIRMGIGETFEDAVARVRKNVRVSVGYIEEDGWYGADGYPQVVQPIAWMPMPEPYKEGEENG